MIKLLIVDDDALVRSFIRRLAAGMPEVSVVGEARTGEEALQQAEQHQPDVILLDLMMPLTASTPADKKNGQMILDELLRQDTRYKVLILSVDDQAVNLKSLIQRGAKGYLTKERCADELEEALQDVMEGRRPFLDTEIAVKVALNELVQEEPQNRVFDDLSKREWEVMKLVLSGKRNQDIAELLNLSPKTIATYRSRLLSKLGVSNDVELTQLAISHGLIQLNQNMYTSTAHKG